LRNGKSGDVDILPSHLTRLLDAWCQVENNFLTQF
jgi:hypothetical protein